MIQPSLANDRVHWGISYSNSPQAQIYHKSHVKTVLFYHRYMFFVQNVLAKSFYTTQRHVKKLPQYLCWKVRVNLIANLISKDTIKGTRTKRKWRQTIWRQSVHTRQFTTCGSWEIENSGVLPKPTTHTKAPSVWQQASNKNTKENARQHS